MGLLAPHGAPRHVPAAGDVAREVREDIRWLAFRLVADTPRRGQLAPSPSPAFPPTLTRKRHNTGRSFLNTCFGNPGHFSLGIICSVGIIYCLDDLDTTLLPGNTRSV